MCGQPVTLEKNFSTDLGTNFLECNLCHNQNYKLNNIMYKVYKWAELLVNINEILQDNKKFIYKSQTTVLSTRGRELDAACEISTSIYVCINGLHAGRWRSRNSRHWGLKFNVSRAFIPVNTTFETRELFWEPYGKQDHFVLGFDMTLRCPVTSLLSSAPPRASLKTVSVLEIVQPSISNLKSVLPTDFYHFLCLH